MVDQKAKRRVVGNLRPSQLVYSFGVGAVIDLPHISAMVLGLDDWEESYRRLAEQEVPLPVLEEPRLLAAVRDRLGNQVSELRGAPIARDEGVATGKPPWMTGGESSGIGVPLAVFPQWMLCPACRRLAPLKSDLFKLRTSRFRADETRYVHESCRSAPTRSALPARFLVACEAGHIDDFPWVEFVHGGDTDCKARLRFEEFGPSGDARSIRVKCDECGANRRMSDAFGGEGVGQCSGKRPHLRDSEDKPCPNDRKTILLGASNAWFPISLSALSIPPVGDELTKLVHERWSELEDVEDVKFIERLRRRNLLSAFSRFSAEDLLAAIEAKREAPAEEIGNPLDLKAPEWQVFTNPRSDLQSSQSPLQLREVKPPAGFSDLIERVVSAEKLREVRALTGFTRIESPGFGGEWDLEGIETAPLAREGPWWVPAVEVRGEGIFIQFQESAIREWEQRLYRLNPDRYYRARRAWMVKHGSSLVGDDDRGFARFLLIHSFSHALMREFALECGYAVASIRERIYAAPEEGESGAMAGLLLYTSASDSEGTLGGLVKLGEPDELERHIQSALVGAALCASDPPCSERVPEEDDFVMNWAACHACLFAPETSCERGNQLLDRTVLVETFVDAGLGFFPY